MFSAAVRRGRFGLAVRRVGRLRTVVASTVCLARSKDALHAEGGEATLEAPDGRQE